MNWQVRRASLNGSAASIELYACQAMPPHMLKRMHNYIVAQLSPKIRYHFQKMQQNCENMHLIFAYIIDYSETCLVCTSRGTQNQYLVSEAPTCLRNQQMWSDNDGPLRIYAFSTLCYVCTNWPDRTQGCKEIQKSPSKYSL